MPSSYSGRTASEYWFTPFDDEARDMEARFAQLCQMDKGPVEENWYNLSLDLIFSETSKMIARGIDTEMTLDRTQESGPSEKPKVLKFYQTNPDSARAGKFLIGTSPEHGAIDHLKGCAFNVQKNGYSVPDGDFETIDDAMAAGYPVTWLGSWNPSATASNQVNFVVITAGKLVQADFSATIAKVRAFISVHQKQYQIAV